MGDAQVVSTIARERVVDLAARHAEPQWLKEVRLAAWESYLQTPAPTPRDATWHRTDASGLDLSALIALDFARNGRASEPHEWLKPVLAHFSERAGVVSQAAHAPLYMELSQEASEKGVIFCEMGLAVDQHEELLKQYLSIPANAEQDGKFGLMTKSLFNCGLFLYVPAGVKIEAPFLSFLSVSAAPGCAAGGAVFPRLLVVAGENSSVNLIHTSASSGGGNEPARFNSLHAGITEIHAKPGARISLLDFQNYDDTVYSVTRTVDALEADATVSSLTVALGGKLVKGDIATVLSGRGAAREVLGVVLGSGTEHYNFDTIEEHDAPDTRSDINFRTALKDSSTSVYQGIIRVTKQAQRTDAYQSNKNLLLGAQAKADSIPKLEILADDVKCSHGATVGPVDLDQVFYLMSRGLSRSESEELIVLGFFKTVLQKFSQPQAVRWVEDAVSARVLRSSQQG